MNEIIEAERNEFQDTIWRDMEARKNISYFDIGELVDYPIFPKVFNPVVAKASLFFLENLGVKKGDTVLDMFTGSGIDAIYARIKGALFVDAVDNFLPAFQNAKFAVKHYGLENDIKTFYGDMFDRVNSNRFDLIIANPPFRGDKKPRTQSEKSMRDEDYATLEKFWKNAGKHLRLPEYARVRMVFSDVGDMAYNEQLMKQNNYKFKVVAQTKYASSIRINVYEARPDFYK